MPLAISKRDNMQNYHNNTIGVISGIIGGVGKFYLQIQTPFILNIMGAIITAFLCGVAGVAGKEAFIMIRNYFKKRHANRITKQA